MLKKWTYIPKNRKYFYNFLGGWSQTPKWQKSLFWSLRKKYIDLSIFWLVGGPSLPTNTIHYCQPLTLTATTHHWSHPPSASTTATTHHGVRQRWVATVPVVCIIGWWWWWVAAVDGSSGWQWWVVEWKTIKKFFCSKWAKKLKKQHVLIFLSSSLYLSLNLNFLTLVVTTI